MNGNISNTVQYTTWSVRLVFSVNELQVDGVGRAEQAMGFGLDFRSERRNADVELLNELYKEQRHKHVNQKILIIDYQNICNCVFKNC